MRIRRGVRVGRGAVVAWACAMVAGCAGVPLVQQVSLPPQDGTGPSAGTAAPWIASLQACGDVTAAAELTFAKDSPTTAQVRVRGDGSAQRIDTHLPQPSSGSASLIEVGDQAWVSASDPGVTEQDRRWVSVPSGPEKEEERYNHVMGTAEELSQLYDPVRLIKRLAAVQDFASHRSPSGATTWTARTDDDTFFFIELGVVGRHSTFTATVTADPQGHLDAITLQLLGQDPGDLSSAFSMRFHDWGQPVEISAPLPSQITTDDALLDG